MIKQIIFENVNLFIEKFPDKFFIFKLWIKKNQINFAIRNQWVVSLSVETYSVTHDILVMENLFYLIVRMLQSIDNFQKSLKSGNIHTSKKYIQKSLEKYDFIYYEDIEQTEERVKRSQNNSGIAIFDECI